MKKKIRFEAMKTILQDIAKANKPLVFKGGSALMFFYQLDRFSEDLDFDEVEKTDTLNLLSKRYPVDVSKYIDTTERYKVDIGLSKPLKVEVSFRKRSLDDFQNFSGINVYTVNSIFKQKLNAMENRTIARDLYDVAFILDNYFSRLDDSFKEKAKSLLKDFDKLLEKYLTAFVDDELIGESGFDKTEGRLKEVKQKIFLKDNSVKLNLLFGKGENKGLRR